MILRPRYATAERLDMSHSRWVVILAGLSLLGGCSSAPPQEDIPVIVTLQEVHGLLVSPDRPPNSLDDVVGSRWLYQSGYEAISSGDVVVLWGITPKGEGEAGKDETVIAYEKDVPTNGGYVLLSAGTVKKMTAGEFAAAPKGTPN
jgi:hypothetical protein